MKVTKPSTGAEKSTNTTVDTIMFDRKEAQGWVIPPFQRSLTVNEKVRALAEQIKNDGGVIPGILTFGVLDRERFLIDGQQRREAFLISEKAEGFADARIYFCKTMAEMAEEYDRLNSHLVNMKPDDHLKALEYRLVPLQILRRECSFVGYSNIRRGERSAVVSMSVALRSWNNSHSEVPAASGISSKNIAYQMTDESSKQLARFLNCAMRAWGRDDEYARLWNALNMTLCMWLYRRTVLGAYSAKSATLSDDLFQKCLMSLSASETYLDWLMGRKLGDGDRAPCYNRVKTIFVKRLQEETGRKPSFPAPAWAHG